MSSRPLPAPCARIFGICKSVSNPPSVNVRARRAGLAGGDQMRPDSSSNPDAWQHENPQATLLKSAGPIEGLGQGHLTILGP